VDRQYKLALQRLTSPEVRETMRLHASKAAQLGELKATLAERQRNGTCLYKDMVDRLGQPVFDKNGNRSRAYDGDARVGGWSGCRRCQ